MKFSLRTILIFCFTSIISISIIAIILPSYYFSKDIMTKHSHEIMNNISTFALDKSKTYMQAARDAAQLTQKLGSKDIVSDDDITSMQTYFYEQLQINRQFSSIYYGKENGDFVMVLRDKDEFLTKIISNDALNNRQVKTIHYDKYFKFKRTDILENDKYDPRARPWYKLAKKDQRLVWTDPYVFFTLKKPGITTATPLYGVNNKLKGVVGVDIEISDLSLFIANLKISDNSKVFIMDKSLKIVAFPSVKTIEVDEKNSKARLLKIDEIEDKVATKAYKELLSMVDVNELKDKQVSTFEANDKKYLTMFLPFEMNNIKWIIGMYVPEDDYLGILKQNQIYNILWMLLIGMISIGVSYIIAQSISKPILRLQKMAHELKELNLDTKSVEPSNLIEINEAIESFNTMKESLASSIQQQERKQKVIIEKNRELYETKELLQDIIDNAPIRIFWKDKESVYIGANKLFMKDWGLDNISDLIGKKDSDFTKKEYEKYMEDDNNVMENNIAKLNYIETLTDKDGTKQIVTTSKVPLHNIDGNVIGILGVYNDITEQVKTQEELKEKELLVLHQSKLAAMGEMIGNIAHQWRQPLSIVSTLVMSMQIKLEMGAFDEEQFNKKLSDMNDALQHMSRTIDDFRDFFKPQKEKRVFNIKDICEKTIALLSSDLGNKKIKIISNIDDIEIEGFDSELIQVLLNILNNAVYVLDEQKNTDKLICINVYKQQNSAIIEIQDSAGGIKEDIIHRIFEPYFTTKHKSQGTGIGLYMSEEIVSKHMRGSLTVTNTPFMHDDIQYKGAKFSISLPMMV